MKTLKQIDIARKTGLTRGFISRILNPKDPLKPSWDTSKRLGKASEIDPVIWADKNLEKLRPMFGLSIINPEKIKSALKKNAISESQPQYKEGAMACNR